jgi:chloramphenicol O-acetyltransferase
MSYWLVKSEPDAYSWEQLEKDKQTDWTGVRNYAARNHLKAMKKGDEVLFYHSNVGLEIVGIAKVAKEAYQDPSTDETAWVVVACVTELQIFMGLLTTQNVYQPDEIHTTFSSLIKPTGCVNDLKITCLTQSQTHHHSVTPAPTWRA